MTPAHVQGSTVIRELMQRHPDGRATDLMIRLGWSCAYCAARDSEPLSLAAKRHGNPVRAVIECFRALEAGTLSDTLVTRAATKQKIRRDPLAAWRSNEH